MSSIRRTVREFIAANHIRINVEWADSNPNMNADERWSQGARHFKCVLRKGKRRMTVPFSQGAAHEREPTAADVLECLASDSSGVEQSNFEEWARDLGYNPDSHKAEKTYKICKIQAKNLCRLLGAEEYETLLYHTEF